MQILFTYCTSNYTYCQEVIETMKQFTAQCPMCGTWNRQLYLEETGGWMECVRCGRVVKALTFVLERGAVLRPAELPLRQRPGNGA